MVENIEIREDSPVPADKGCCLSFPLRYGLTNWGYFKMIVSGFIILMVSYALLHTCMMLGFIVNGNHRNRIYVDIAVTSVALILFVTDLLLTMPFIVGAHQALHRRCFGQAFQEVTVFLLVRIVTIRMILKNEKLLRAFYIFNIVTWVMTILLSALAISVSLESWLSRYMSVRSLVVTLLNFSAYHLIIMMQTYFLLLLKGEIIKMRNNGEANIKHVNQEAKAECAEKSEEKLTDGDTEILEE